MSVKFYVVAGQNRVEFELAKANNLQVMNIIQGVFGFLGHEIKTGMLVTPQSLSHTPEVVVSKKSEENVSGDDDKGNSSIIPKVADVPKVDFKEDTKVESKGLCYHPKPLPNAKGEFMMTQSLGDVLGPLLGIAAVDGSENSQDSQNANSYIVSEEKSLIEPTKQYSGIIYNNGVPQYQTYVYCKNLKCGQHKKVFVKETQHSVYCPACDTKHIRRDATKGGFPEQDDFGNYFKADRLWVVNHKSHQERIKSPLK
ncbi:hypothetical protein [Brevibacillus laterosporus]|uniref:Uncharacterized protein n=1 Tax=Brevibacillus laterosporus TaxID=1465 RepID=A0AAP3DD55_BRELA|nr:hypothetical protein [Brevibacillus laterosporus]MCR8978702.1 hypothetical protein [Brevibacillus laterosporus]MCZ0805858.1 hypothetical protein [Brevibacillus laterosporus]MCZ0824376.1 hypothetical protein [Brevibacillus laterosporus]MCZ0848280.1 hypothetical protein [Brevibacillus laterosporus]